SGSAPAPEIPRWPVPTAPTKPTPSGWLGVALEAEEYARIARLEEAHWWYAGMRRAMLLLLDEEVRAAKPQRILDAGCGTGGMLGPLERFGTAFGVDLAPEAAAIWCERGLKQVTRGSVTALPFADGAFDLVTSFDVGYHLAAADDTRTFAPLARSPRPCRTP